MQRDIMLNVFRSAEKKKHWIHESATYEHFRFLFRCYLFVIVISYIGTEYAKKIFMFKYWIEKKRNAAYLFWPSQ